MRDINSESQLEPDQGPVAITDTEIDPEQIMSVIRSRIRGFRMGTAYDQQNQLTFGAATYPNKPDDISYDMALYRHLDLANIEHSQTGTTLDIRDSAISRVPIIGRLWRELQIWHQGPALFYANRVAERQAQINGQLVKILNTLLSANQEQQREINCLREELKHLRQEDQ